MKPTDGEIRKESFDRQKTLDWTEMERKIFVISAKWMRDQMQSYADQEVSRAVRERDEEIKDWIERRIKNHQFATAHYDIDVLKIFLSTSPAGRPSPSVEPSSEPDQPSILEEVKRLIKQNDEDTKAGYQPTSREGFLLKGLTEIINKHHE